MAKPVKHYDKWRIRWVDENGRRQSRVYETLKEAEYSLAKYQAQVGAIALGYEEKLSEGKTFEDLCEEWLNFHAAQKRSLKSDRSIINVHLRPSFGRRLLKTISVADVARYKQDRAHLNFKTLHNHLTLLISMLNLAVELRWLKHAPRIKKPRLPTFSSDYRYLRTAEEIQHFLITARNVSEGAFALYSTAIFTGLRQGELAGLRWQDVDLEKRLITVQRSFRGPTKAGDVRYVPILDPLLAILKEWRAKSSGLFLFCNSLGKPHTPSARIFQEVLHEVLKRAGFPESVSDLGEIRRYIVFHDLRHTFASHWMMRGGDIFKLQRILGHKDIKMTMRYAHLSSCAFALDYSRFEGSHQFDPSTFSPVQTNTDSTAK